MTDSSHAILITGGSRGIGATTAELAAKSGYDVCFSFLNRSADADLVRATVERHGRRALAVQADLASESDIVNLWKRAIETFGSVHALINNAGILEQQMPLVDFSADRLHRVFDVNVIGSILCAREAVRHMSVSRGGAGGVIVNVSSASSRTGSPHEYVDYAASKGAIDTLTIGLAKEVASEGIRVNAVRPGPVHTEIHASGGEPNRIDRIQDRIPMKRGGQPHEVAEAIMWLVSDKASYATGSILDVTGGV